MFKESPEDFSAMGNEKIVHLNPNNPDLVHATLRKKESGYHPTALQMRGRFYLSKVLALLFPGTIPEIHAAGTKEGGFLEMQRFETDAPHKGLQAIRAKTETGKSISAAERERARQLTQERDHDPAIENFIHALRTLGVVVDPTADNYSYSSEGILEYLDNSFVPWQINRVGKKLVKEYDADKLSQTIEQLAPEQKEHAQKYLERLNQLFKEEKENLTVHPEEYPVKTLREKLDKK